MDTVRRARAVWSLGCGLAGPKFWLVLTNTLYRPGFSVTVRPIELPLNVWSAELRDPQRIDRIGHGEEDVRRARSNPPQQFVAADDRVGGPLGDVEGDLGFGAQGLVRHTDRPVALDPGLHPIQLGRAVHGPLRHDVPPPPGLSTVTPTVNVSPGPMAESFTVRPRVRTAGCARSTAAAAPPEHTAAR